MLDVIVEILFIRKLEKELDNVQETATTHFKRANKFREQLNETVKKYDKQAKILLDNAAELRSENEELDIFKYNITKILNSKDFAHDKVEKLKELVRLLNQN